MRAVLTSLLCLVLAHAGLAQHLNEQLFPELDPQALADAQRRWATRMADEGVDPVVWSLPPSERSFMGTLMTVQDGPWNDPATWDCECIPGEGDDATVLHNLTLNAPALVNTLTVEGSMQGDEPSSLTLRGDLWVSGSVVLEHASLVMDAPNGRHTFGGEATFDQVWMSNNSSLALLGALEVRGHLELDDAVMATEMGELKLTKNAFGRATVSRVRGGAVSGPVTRVITLNAMPNSSFYVNNNYAIRQLVAVGLENVAAVQLIDDIPTYGFTGADIETGVANVYYWDESEGFVFVADTSDVLPVWKGLYLNIPPQESYELDVTGTLPSTSLAYELTATASGVNCLSNATGMGLNLAATADDILHTSGSMFCWNTEMLRYDLYVDGLSNNGMGNYVEPNEVCQLLMLEDYTATLGETTHVRNHEQALIQSEVACLAHIQVGLDNTSGFYDNARLLVQEDASFSNLAIEDCVDVYSNLNSCNVYFRHQGWRYGISQVGFEGKTVLVADVMMASMMPVDNVFTVRFEEVAVGDHCAYLQWEGETEWLPLEAGMMNTVTLANNANHQDKPLAKLYLVPPVRSEATSTGCESGEGSTVAITPNGEGPWDIALTNDAGESVVGTWDAPSSTMTFGDLPSGTYTSSVTTEDLFACGTQTFTHTVVSGTSLAFEPVVATDCGEGGRIELDVEGGLGALNVVWEHGATGNVLEAVPAGSYTAIATDAALCADTLTVEVAALPAVSLTSENTTCESEGPTAIHFDTSDSLAAWTLTLSQNGAVLNHLEDHVGPTTFEDLGSGTFVVEITPDQGFGCDATFHEFALLEPVPMTLTSHTEVQCAEAMPGAASVEVEGGVGAIELVWSNGATGASVEGLSAGDYTVTATDELGCKGTLAVTVAWADEANVSAVSPGCDGEGITELHMDGTGSDPWNYLVYASNGDLVAEIADALGNALLTELPSDTYYVLAIHQGTQGCPAQEHVVNLVAPSDLDVTWDVTPLGCDGEARGEIALDIEGSNGPFVVEWSHGAGTPTLTDLEAGQYYATVTDLSGCFQEVRIALEEAPTVVADFRVPMGGLTDGEQGMTLGFTNESEGATGFAWFFGDSDVPVYDTHPMHTFDEPGTYDVFLNAWNDQCSHTVRKTVLVSVGETPANDTEVDTETSSVNDYVLAACGNPWTTDAGWALDLGAAHTGMVLVAFDLNGRQLCAPAYPDANGRIHVEADQWPSLVLLRLIHEPTMGVKTWKMVR